MMTPASHRHAHRRARLRAASIALLACAIALIAAFPAISWANSARTHWEGVASTGAIVVDEECPIIVDREVLTFEIDGFPQEFYGDDEESAAFTSRVTAAYTFSNPASYAVNATLAFPFGTLPDYYQQYSYSISSPFTDRLISEFGVAIDGAPVETTLRHTLFYPSDKFRIERDVVLLADDLVSDPFYAPDLPVTKFTYEVSGLPEDSYAATVGFRWTPSSDAKILLVNQSGLQRCGDDMDSVIVNTWAENGRTVTVYVLGNAPEGLMAGLYADGSCTTGIDGRVTNVGTETLTFGDIAFAEWSEDSPVLRHDWYNAMVEFFNRSEVGADSVIMSAESYVALPSQFDLTPLLMRWYEYDISLEPGQTIVNEVTAPMHPSIDASYEPSIHEYTYLLSPAQLWAGFGALNVIIKTPFYLINSNLEGFTSFDGAAGTAGYELTLDGLPEGELSFTLSAAENPGKTSTYGAVDILLMIVSTVLETGFALVVVLAAIALALIAVKKRNKKR